MKDEGTEKNGAALDCHALVGEVLAEQPFGRSAGS